jgi:dihydroorotate dehydrogenase
MASMGLYSAIGRPLMFALPPETAHRVASTALGLPLPWSAIGGALRDPRLATEVAGVAMRNPVGLAAGFDKNARMTRGLSRLGFGYVIVGTVSLRPREGNPKPRVARNPSERSLTNAMGIPNDGVEAVARRLEAGGFDAPVIASIADEEPEDVIAVYERLAPLVDGVELNVSSPNSPWRHSGRDNASHLRGVLSALEPRRRVPLWVKLPPFGSPEERSDVLGLARIAADGGADALTCSNTRPIRDQRMPTGGGGLSGAPLSEATPSIVEQVRAALPDMAINACGGILTPADARRCLEAGATTLQIYTALIYRGPRIVRDLTLAAMVAASRPDRQD